VRERETCAPSIVATILVRCVSERGGGRVVCKKLRTCMCVYVYVYMCVFERERERERSIASTAAMLLVT